MKNVCFIIILFLNTLAYALVLEDAEDQSVERWNISQSSEIENVVDAMTNSQVIKLNSPNYQYHKLIFSQNTTFKQIKWDMKIENPFYVYVDVTTIQGSKSLYYSPVTGSNLGENYIHHGLGQSVNDSTWHGFSRDIEKDLRDANDDNRLVSIDGFRIRAFGKVYIDNVVLFDTNSSEDMNNTNEETNNTNEEANNTVVCTDEQLIEDAEDGNINPWTATGSGTVVNKLDTDKNSRVITFDSSLHEYFKIDFTNNNSAKQIEWEMKATKPFYVYVNVSTTLGVRNLYYSGINRTILGNIYIHHGLGYDKIDGNWHKIIRNIEDDLKAADSTNKLISIDSVVVRSTDKFSIDNIKLLCDNSNDSNPIVNNVNLQNGLIAHYKFEDNAQDSSEKNNNGTIHGNPLFIEDGVKGKGISFNGINDYIQVPLNAELRFNPNFHSFSVSGWMKPESMPMGCGYVPLIDAYRYHLSNQWLDVKRDFYSNPGGSGIGINYKLWDTENWHLFTGTWEVNGTNVLGRYYIDGILRDEKMLTTVPSGNYQWIGLYIARSAHCGGGFGKFKADELRIYNRAINQLEVESIYSELTVTMP